MPSFIQNNMAYIPTGTEITFDPAELTFDRGSATIDGTTTGGTYSFTLNSDYLGYLNTPTLEEKIEQIVVKILERKGFILGKIPDKSNDEAFEKMIGDTDGDTMAE